MFLHLSVILSTGGHDWQGVFVAVAAGVHGEGHLWKGACMAGGHAWQGGMRGGGHVWWGTYVVGGMPGMGEGCIADTMRYGQ